MAAVGEHQQLRRAGGFMLLGLESTAAHHSGAAGWCLAGWCLAGGAWLGAAWLYGGPAVPPDEGCPVDVPNAGRASLTLLLVNSRHGWKSAAPTTTADRISTPAVAARVLCARMKLRNRFIAQG